MASLAIRGIVQGGQWLLRALGVGAAAGGAVAVNEAIEEAERSRTEPIARAEPRAEDKTKDCDCPADTGAPVARSTAGWSQISIDYQARIGGMPTGPGTITEWLFVAPTFDGYDASQCLLKEAKGHYDQFFEADGRVKRFWQGDRAIIAQAASQGSTVAANPPTRLRWYFMEPRSYAYFLRVLEPMAMPIEMEFHP